MIAQFKRRIGITLLFVISTVCAILHADEKNVLAQQALLGNSIRLPPDKSDPIKNNKRIIRILVTYNDTNYFVINGKQRGLEYELMHAFETFLNKDPVPADKYRGLAFISVPFDQLIPGLLEGKGDIAAAGLTVTEERKKVIAFSNPYRNQTKEIVVKSKVAPPLNTIEDLSGKWVYVVSGSSYVTHLEALNEKLSSKGKARVKTVEMDPNLEAEDILQMVNAGVYTYTVVDSHLAELWSQMLNNIQPLDHIVINQGGETAWAVRKNNSWLLKELNEFVDKHKQGTILGNLLFKRYYQNTHWIKNPLSKESRSNNIRYMPLLKKYGKKYNIDWKLLAALAFQESGMNQNEKSQAGAVGIMQIKPSTAAGKNIAIKNVTNNIENNIHAGTKYLDFLHRRYFSDPDIPHKIQMEFTLAAYNAGPARIQSLRNKAKEIGLDPNRWFFNVAHIARKEIGPETVTYVANIYKYYIAYRTADNALNERAKVNTLAVGTPE
ncbi:MAG: transporter substrate-binding domain-containing protein [Gammaproteobacteria bacterium]|nr:transporter substrate-binding domain-containing protein [Gammaproteobacteria bacterium]